MHERERERERESKLVFPKIGTGFIFLALVFGFAFPQLAAATIYQPGATLEPDCAPGSANCGVATYPSSLGTTTPIGNSLLSIEATTTNSILATLRAFTSQVANLFQVQDSNGANVFSINASGALTLGGLNGPLQANAGVVSATTSIGVLYGGTGLTSAPAYGNLLVGNSSGGYTLTATSSLGLSTTNITEGSNLYYTTTRVASVLAGTTTTALAEGNNLYFTNARSDDRFVTDLAATSSVASITTLANLVSTGALISGSIGSGFGNVNIGSNTFTGNGSGLTALNANNLTNFGTPFYTYFSATTTNALTEGSNNLYFTDARVNSYIHASSTIPKTYTVNTFTGATTFSGGLTFDTWNGPLQANAGVVSATTSIGVLYGGTGVTSFTQGWLFSSGDGNALSASTSPTVNYITATSTTATSTFAGGISITGGGLKLGNLTSCNNLGTDSAGDVNCQLGQQSLDVRKSADESLTSNAVLQNDDELSFAIGANETWVFQFNLMYTTLATPDIQIAVTAPSGATCDYTGSVTDLSLGAGSTTCGGAVALTGGSATANDPLYIYGAVANGATAGTVQLQWAQNTSNSNTTTVHRGSTLSAFRINGGADIGEVYYAKDASLVPGTVVALDGSLPGGVRRAMPHDEAVGIVSTKPGIVIGDTIGAHDGVPVIVALVGRVPVKVNTENGAIQAGDYLAPSSVPGIAMKAKGLVPVIGRAMSAYDAVGVGMVVAFIKNSDMGAIEQVAVLIGDISPKVNALGSDNGLSTLVATLKSEVAHDPIAIIVKKIADSTQFLTDFIVARVTAIRGYFDEVFAKKVHTGELCVKKSDSSEVCVGGDQLNSLLQTANIAPASMSPTTPPANRRAGNHQPLTTEPTATVEVTPTTTPSTPTSSSTPNQIELGAGQASSVIVEPTLEPLPEVTAGTTTETPTDTTPTPPDLPAGEAGVTAPVVVEPTSVEPVVTPDSTGSPQAEPTPPTAEQPVAPVGTEASQ